MNAMIKPIDADGLGSALELVNNVFAEFVAVDYSAQGNATFAAYLENKYEEVASDLHTGNKKMWGYYKDNKIVGVVGTRGRTHISLMFVDSMYHRQGIATQLFNTVISDLITNPEYTEVTVNASPYAVKIYEHLGFTKTAMQQENEGILFVPMKYLISLSNRQPPA